MINIGCHVSVSKGYEAMGKTTLDLGGDTFAFFLRSPRGGKARDIQEEDVAALRNILEEHHFGKLVAHGPYTMNLCAANPTTRQNGEAMLHDDLAKMDRYLPGNYYNFHPGSHVGQGPEAAIPMIAESLNKVLHDGMKTTVLLETMAGKGSEMGRSFEELRAIIDLLDRPEQVGVCFDTCHTWDGGYDLARLDDVLNEFDHVLGLDRLLAVHLNDSKNVCGAHKDRHEKLGQGAIGLDILKSVCLHPALQGRPFILETPNELPGYQAEIATVRSFFA